MLSHYQPGKHRLLVGVLGAIALLTCVRVWVSPMPLIEPARAQIPDSGAQRQRLLEEARNTNRLLAEIKQLLQDHTFNVRLQGADNQSSAPATPGARPETKP